MTSPDGARAMSFEQAQGLVQADDALKRAIDKVAELDFTMLKRKLFIDQGWTNEFCDEVENLYRKFLALHVRYPEMKICPTGPIDSFWHAHILDTAAYAADCSHLFGEMFHHFPYFGMRGPEDKAALDAAFEGSVDMFIRHFGIDPTAGDTQARSCRPQRCP